MAPATPSLYCQIALCCDCIARRSSARTKQNVSIRPVDGAASGFGRPDGVQPLKARLDCADHQMRLIPHDDCPPVNTPKRSTPGNPVHRAESEKRRPKELHERMTTRSSHEHSAHFIGREQQQ